MYMECKIEIMCVCGMNKQCVHKKLKNENIEYTQEYIQRSLKNKHEESPVDQKIRYMKWDGRFMIGWNRLQRGTLGVEVVVDYCWLLWVGLW